ncbi:MAG: MAPEG family protein [Geminicoccaceae bacterium]
MITTFFAVVMAGVYMAVAWYMIWLRKLSRKQQADWPLRWYDRCGHGRDHMAQYLPFALFLMFLIEQGGAPGWLLYLLGLLLMAGYALHLWGFAQYPGNYKTPSIGTMLITLVYAICCLVGLGQFLAGGAA